MIFCLAVFFHLSNLVTLRQKNNKQNKAKRLNFDTLNKIFPSTWVAQAGDPGPGPHLDQDLDETKIGTEDLISSGSGRAPDHVQEMTVTRKRRKAADQPRQDPVQGRTVTVKVTPGRDPDLPVTKRRRKSPRKAAEGRRAAHLTVMVAPRQILQWNFWKNSSMNVVN